MILGEITIRQLSDQIKKGKFKKMANQKSKHKSLKINSIFQIIRFYVQERKLFLREGVGGGSGLSL